MRAQRHEIGSRAIDGTQRFRKRIVDRLDWVWRAALGNNELFVGAHATASAYDIADGHLIWTRSVANEVYNALDRYFVDSIAVAPDGSLTISRRIRRGMSSSRPVSASPLSIPPGTRAGRT